LQADLKKKGVQMLGFNCADDPDLVRRFLKRAGITFPTILDSSPAAQQVSNEYGVQGVPAHFIISGGWVVDSWMGFELGEPRAYEAFKKLGIE
jgi:peroxiredoxin